MMGGRGLVPVLHGASSDRPDEADTLAAAEAVAAALMRLGYDAPIQDLGLDLEWLATLKGQRPLCVFNLIDAIDGDCRLAPLASLALEHFGLKFTGGGSAAWLSTLSKTQTKRTLRAAGLPTPEWWRVGDAQSAEGSVIVKADIEHGSLGMDEASVVEASIAALEIERRSAQFGTPFFAEQFIEGREFNIALLETETGLRVLPVAEIVFQSSAGSRRIVGYDAKWKEHSPEFIGTPRCFGIETREPQLAARLGELSLACWELFHLRGYARVDFRVSPSGAPFILEVNVNPCLTPGAGFASTAEKGGLGYDAVVEAVVQAAYQLQ